VGVLKVLFMFVQAGLLEPCFDLKFLVSAAYVFAVAAGKGDFPHSAGVKSAASLLKMAAPGSIYSRVLEVVVAKLAGVDSFSRGLVVCREGARLSHYDHAPIGATLASG
jgi:hypothetical protein